ncbi:MAG: prolipoprotein diacylglyceryl transferase [Rhodospirillales bacterium]|nr:prolipoprotein diacylglyceryl transferase [Rhodospirillales bacterium]
MIAHSLAVLVYPGFDPIAVRLGPIAIRWYALAYITALLLGWRLARHLVRRAPAVATLEQVDDFLTWATLGVVLGGRLGYVLFYQPSLYFAHPLLIPAVWDGGMSFHGGAIGVAVAIFVFCRRNAIPILAFGDRIAVPVPIGLGLGRIANFINGELWGRPVPGCTPDHCWLPIAMIYPAAGPMPRYPSELIEAALEGILLLVVMLLIARSDALRRRPGIAAGVFLIGYGLCRIVGEHFREPDPFLGYLAGGLTMGQILSLPMLLIGAGLIWHARRRPAMSV